MKIEQLYYLREIANSKSISAAAKRLYIGQTTLSAIIKSVEEEMGIRIFRRTSSGVEPTPDGVQFFAMAENIISSYNMMLQTFSTNSDPDKRVHFLGIPSICNYLSAFLVETLQNFNPQASIVIHETERKKIVGEIQDGIANIAVTTLDDCEVGNVQEQASRNGLEMRLIGKDKFYLCVRADYEKFSKRTVVDINELMEERYAAPTQYSNVANGTIFTDSFRKLNCVATLPNPELVKQAVLNCNIIAILSGRSLVNDPLIHSGALVAVPLTGFDVPNSINVYLLSRKRANLSQYEKVVYDAITGICEYVPSAQIPSLDEGDHYPPLKSLLHL